MKQIIEAISFFHNGERLRVKVNTLGKFKIPVSEVKNGQLKTRIRNLTAKQVIEHDIIKNCDPTLYLPEGKRVRVYHGGDSSYLPAPVDGIIQKHDNLNKPELPKLKKGAKVLSNFSKKNSSSRCDYEQSAFDSYGLWPHDDDYEAD